MVIIVLKMPHKMQIYRLRYITFKYPIMFRTAGFRLKNVIEQFAAQCAKQIVLRFKMCVKCCSAHICPDKDLPNRDLMIPFLRKQVDKRPEDRTSGFSLSSVHISPYTFPNLFRNEQSAKYIYCNEVFSFLQYNRTECSVSYILYGTFVENATGRYYENPA